MADVLTKVKMYVFLSLVVIVLNMSAIVVLALSNQQTDINKALQSNSDTTFTIPYPIDYVNMSVEDRRNYINSLHGGINEWSWSFDPIEFVDGSKISVSDYSTFINGGFNNSSQQTLLIDYTKSTDTDYVSKTSAVTLTSFLPFASIFVQVIMFNSVYPFNLLVGLIISLISTIQAYILIAIILNHLPFFNV